MDVVRAVVLLRGVNVVRVVVLHLVVDVVALRRSVHYQNNSECTQCKNYK